MGSSDVTDNVVNRPAVSMGAKRQNLKHVTNGRRFRRETFLKENEQKTETKKVTEKVVDFVSTAGVVDVDQKELRESLSD